MISFQNCAQKLDSQNTTSSVASNLKLPPVNSDELPMNKEFNIDENNNPIVNEADGQSNVSNDVNIQIEDREQERIKDINEAIAACKKLAPVIIVGDTDVTEINPQNTINPKNTTNPRAQIAIVKKEISGLRGDKVLSPADFYGDSEIKSISNSYGRIILCNLAVDEVYKTGGKIIAVNSSIKKVTSHFGTIDLVDGSAVIDASNVKIYRTSEDAAL